MLRLAHKRRDRTRIRAVRNRPHRRDNLVAERLRDFEHGCPLTRERALLCEACVQRLLFGLDRGNAGDARLREHVVRLDVRVRRGDVRPRGALRARRGLIMKLACDNALDEGFVFLAIRRRQIVRELASYRKFAVVGGVSRHSRVLPFPRLLAENAYRA